MVSANPHVLWILNTSVGQFLMLLNRITYNPITGLSPGRLQNFATLEYITQGSLTQQSEIFRGRDQGFASPYHSPRASHRVGLQKCLLNE